MQLKLGQSNRGVPIRTCSHHKSHYNYATQKVQIVRYSALNAHTSILQHCKKIAEDQHCTHIRVLYRIFCWVVDRIENGGGVPSAHPPYTYRSRQKKVPVPFACNDRCTL